MKTQVPKVVKRGQMGDEELGKLFRRFEELKRKINDGSIGFDWAMNEMQKKVFEFQDLKSLPRPWKVWKTIKTGTYQNPDALYQDLEKEKISVTCLVPVSRSPFSDLKISPRKELVDLVKVNLWDLFPRDVAYWESITNAALATGLKFMTLEEGLLLRLDYKDQPKENCLTLGIKSVPVSRGRGGFSVSNAFNSGNVQIDCHYLDADSQWSQDEREFVFVLNRRKAE